MLGNSNAQAEIGYLYLIGKELPQNLPDAGVWFKKAAAQGNFVAHFYREECIKMVMALRKYGKSRVSSI